MTKTISFISEKGGVGKTTSCYHIAAALSAFHKKKVLVLDADYQRGGITGRYFPESIEDFDKISNTKRTLFHHFQELYSASSKDTSIDVKSWVKGSYNVDLIPADKRLSSVSIDKLPSTNSIRENTLSLLSHLKTVKDALTQFSGKYDYILIDSHPEISDVLKSVIFASDYCVSPVKLDRQSSIGVASVLKAIKDVNDDVNMINSTMPKKVSYKPTIFAGSIGMMAREYDGELKETERSEYAKISSSSKIFKNYVTEGDGLRQAARDRCTVFDISSANADKQSLQFNRITSELIKQCP